MRTREKARRVRSPLPFERNYMDSMADTAIKIGDVELARLIIQLKADRKRGKDVENLEK